MANTLTLIASGPKNSGYSDYNGTTHYWFYADNTTGNPSLGYLNVGSSYSDSKDWRQNAFIRWDSVDIPAKGQVVSANLVLKFYVGMGITAGTKIRVCAHNVGNSSYPLSSSEFMSLPLTTAYIDAVFPDESGTMTITGLAPIIQEIINRADWVKGNALTLVLKENGNPSGQNHVAIFNHTYTPNTDTVKPKLTVTYDPPTGQTPKTIIERSTDQTTWSQIAQVTEGRSYDDITVTQGQTYYYRAKKVIGSSESVYSTANAQALTMVKAAATNLSPAPGVTVTKAVTLAAPMAATNSAAKPPQVSVSATISSPVASVTILSPVPQVSAVKNVTLVATRSTLTAQTQTPAFNIGSTLSAIRGAVTIQAPLPLVTTGTTAVVVIPASAVTLQAKHPTLQMGSTITSVKAVAQNQAPTPIPLLTVPVSKASTSLTAYPVALGTGLSTPKATSSLVAPTPGIATNGNTALPAPRAMVSINAPVAVISTGVILPTTKASTTGSAQGPTLLTGSAVTVPSSMVSISAQAPAIATTTTATMSSPIAQSSVQMPTPMILTGTSVVISVGTAIAHIATKAPAVQANVGIYLAAPKATASAKANVPALCYATVITVPRALAQGAVPPPVVSATKMGLVASPTAQATVQSKAPGLGMTIAHTTTTSSPYAVVPTVHTASVITSRSAMARAVFEQPRLLIPTAYIRLQGKLQESIALQGHIPNRRVALRGSISVIVRRRGVL